MNNDNLTEAGPFGVLLWNLGEWLEPAVYMAGLGVAIWAFRQCRSKGYLVVGFYFCLVLFNLIAMPSIRQAIESRRPPDISEQTQQKINAAVQQAIDRVLQEEGTPPTPVAQRSIRFPFGPMLLVVGLWLVARRNVDDHRAGRHASAGTA